MNVLTTAGAVIFILLLLIEIIREQFGDGTNFGIRSLAGAMLPWVVITYAVRGANNENWERKWGIRILGYFLFSGVGYAIVPLLLFVSDQLSAGVPMREVVLSGVLSILLYASVSSFYHGVFTGLLLYVTLQGFPTDLISTDVL